MKLDPSRNRVAILLALVFATTTPLGLTDVQARAPVPRDVQRKLDRWLEHRSLADLNVGVAVADLKTGELIASHQPREVLNPASGAKLITTAAALKLLGPNHSWSTEFSLRGDSLIVTGGGDPKLLPEELGPIMDGVSKELKALNVSRVSAIRFDLSRYDAHQLPPAYAQKLTDAGYRPAIGAAGSSYGAIRVDVRPTRVSFPVQVSVTPATRLEIINDAVTTRGKKSSITITGDPAPGGWLRLRIQGELGVEHPADWVRRRVPDPNRLTAELIRDALTKRGFADESTPIVFDRGARDSKGSKGARVLHTHPSDDLEKTIDDINTWSNNYMAEILFKELGRGAGRPASWERAAPRITKTLNELGVDPSEVRVVNGSGLYRGTLISTGAMVQLLIAVAQDTKLAEPFRSSLARPGRAGTLSGRLRGPGPRDRVWAKTGTLDEVVSLSGYVRTSGDRDLAFAVFINDANASRTTALRAAIDRLIVTLTRL